MDKDELLIMNRDELIMNRDGLINENTN